MRNWLAFAALVAVSNAFAAAEEVPADHQVVQIQVHPTAAIVEVSPPYADLQGCTRSGIGLFKIDLATDKSLFTAVLVAATSKQNVGFGLLGCGGGEFDYPVVKRVDTSY